ncbi:MAG: tRNA threonylcarbamoyladenosine dehydratase [Clostridia bacterium]|nr:tRNA threonylcarbamoyladenosine dehydratase [Clostridia bacterium]
MPSANDPRFSRTALLLGEDAVNTLATKSVAVFGVGGVGGYVVEAIARSGVGKITLFDKDVVDITNINRQIIALESTVGRYKCDVMKERILDINPSAEVVCHNVFYLPENADEFPLDEYDYVVDAIDNVAAKIELAVRTHRAGVKMISAMGAGNKTDPTRFEVTDIYKTTVCPLARVMRRELKARGIPALKVVYSREEAKKPILPSEGDKATRLPTASAAFVPSVAGLIMAREVILDLSCVPDKTKN